MLDLALIFDTTSSMSPCLHEVRRRLKETSTRLYKEIPGIRIAVYGVGNHCDGTTVFRSAAYADKSRHETGETGIVRGSNQFYEVNQQQQLLNAVDNIPASNGGGHHHGGCPACYELAMRDCQKIDWKNDKRVLVVIGDENPSHPKEGEKWNRPNVAWETELKALIEKNIHVYGVHCLNRNHSLKFYQTIAAKSEGIQVSLSQFNEIVELLMAICYKQAPDEALSKFQFELENNNRMSRSLAECFAKLSGKNVSDYGYKSHADLDKDLEVVDPGRFQMLNVDKDEQIREFVARSGANFKVGRGFYEFTKRELIRLGREVVLRDKKSGDMFTGDKAKEMIGAPLDEAVRLSPANLLQYDVFVQSTSNNRVLKANTRFLYEVEKK